MAFGPFAAGVTARSGVSLVLAGVGGDPSTPATFEVRLRGGRPRRRGRGYPGAAPPVADSRRGPTSRVNGSEPATGSRF
jgi:hypothetical protein